MGAGTLGSEDIHLVQADRNQSALADLLGSSTRSPEWIAVVAFYKAAHIAEALFARNLAGADQHSGGHPHRNRTLQINYSSLWPHYSNLYEASRYARYLEVGSGSKLVRIDAFADYMDERGVLDMLADDLETFEAGAAAQLTPGGFARYIP